MKSKKRELLVKSIETGNVVKRFDLTGKSEGYVEKLMRGVLINMSDEYTIEDTKDA